MKFYKLAQYLEKLTDTSSRLSMTDILAELFKNSGEDVSKVVYLILGRVAPQYEPVEFNYSEKLIMRGIASITRIPVDKVGEAFKKAGDIGLLIDELSLPDRKPSLSVARVFEVLEKIAGTGGTNSQAIKESIYANLFRRVSNLELRFINKVLTGNLRLGLSTKTIFDGLALTTGNKGNRSVIEQAYGVRTDLGQIAEILNTSGINSLLSLKVEAGTPVAPKLVEREKNPEAIFKRISHSIVQPKLDGLRVHAHYSKNGFKNLYEKENAEMSLIAREKQTVKLFSRNLESLTDMFPDLVVAVDKLGNAIKAQSFVIDGEAIGIDTKTGKFLPFQETIKRRRKNDITSMSESHPVKLFAFDILELNGKDLLNEQNTKRVDILQKILLKGMSEKIVMTETSDVIKVEQIQELFDKYVAGGYEGIIVKAIDSLYKPGSRNFDWIKLKAGSTEGLLDNIDGVVLGYYVGAGVRTKFGIGAILIGTYDRDEQKFYSLAKVGTGFKDLEWPRIKQDLDELKVNSVPENVVIDESLKPDVIVTPKIIAEIQADMVTKSKVHGGYSLRFPRLKIFGRDKYAEDCTSMEEVKHLFELQSK